MKNQLLFAAICIISLLGCRKSDIQTIQPVALTVKVGYIQEDAALGLAKSGISVKITNLLNGQENTAQTNAEGLVTFPSIVPGNYTLTASYNLTAEEYTHVTSIPVAFNVAFNGTETKSITANSTIELTLKSGRIGDLVIKQFYYAGSNVSRGASFRDQFVEIYNNSNETIYLDSLYFGNTWQSNTRINAGGVPIDWSKADGMPTNIGDASRDYIYAKYLFMIPGTGKQHPLEPGKSIVVAGSAVNHTQDYVTNSGTIQGITDPTLSVDLSEVAFETYLVDYDRANYTGGGTFTPYRWDVDNPKVPNVNVLHVRQGSEWTMDATGREDLFIFKTSKSYNSQDWPKYAVPGTTTAFCAQVRVADVIDAVEILTPLETNRVPKRLPGTLDATGTFVMGGAYSSQSLVRKTLKKIGARKILQDTNNSANDFITKTKADASRTEASFQ